MMSAESPHPICIDHVVSSPYLIPANWLPFASLQGFMQNSPSVLNVSLHSSSPDVHAIKYDSMCLYSMQALEKKMYI